MRRNGNEPGLSVCHLGKFYPPAPGGIETHVRTLAEAQAALGVDVRVLCINHLNRLGLDATWARYGATLTTREAISGVRITRVGRSMTLARVDFCPELPRIVREMNQNPPDVFHLHTPNVTMLLTVAALTSATVPLVITHHSDIVRQRFRHWALAPYERRVYERAATVIVSNEAYAGGSELLAANAHKVRAIPMGIDLSPFVSPDASVARHEEELRREFAGEPLWLSVGRCVYYKGLHTAVEALRRVRGRLLIVGNGPERRNLQRLAERLGVANRIIWWEYTPQQRLIGAYRIADALWFPSNARSEAYGLVQIEAMASGCPVINTHIPHSGVSWVSRHDESGLTVPMNNASALARAANRLLCEPGLRQRLSDGARARAIREFDHLTMARTSVQIYGDVLAGYQSAVDPGHVKLRGWLRQQRLTPANS